MSSSAFAASVEQMQLLDSVLSTLEGVDARISQLHALRAGLLSVAGRIADDIDAASRAAGVASSAEVPRRAVAAEVGAVLRVSDRSVQRQMGFAQEVTGEYPRVFESLSAGRITPAHVRVIVDAGATLPDQPSRDRFSQAVLPVAEIESPNRTRGFARRVADRQHPASITARHVQAKAEHGVWVDALPGGNAKLSILGSAALIYGAHDRLTQMSTTVHRAHRAIDKAGERSSANGARPEDKRAEGKGAEAAGDGVVEPAEGRGAAGRSAVQPPADPRSMGEIRAALALDMLLTGAPTGCGDETALLDEIRATVAVTVPVLTLIHRDRDAGDAGTDTDTDAGGDAAPGAGVDAGAGADVDGPGDPPAELDGVCPIDTDTAARLAGTASGWDRVLTHPITGQLLAVDRYRPSEALRRRLRNRDMRCRFPGCGIRARHCDIDHHHDAVLGGPTSEDNLGDLCRRHHTLKHTTPWHIRRADDGAYEWTSPTGRVHTDRPPPQNTVTFDRPDKPPPF